MEKKIGLSRSEQLFEELIEGMDRQTAKAFYIKFLNDGLDLLSAKAQNYLVKRIGELTDKEPMSKATAEQFIGNLINILGNGFHPDNHMSDYINRHEQPFFDPITASVLQDDFERAKQTLGDDLYKVVKAKFSEMDKG